MTPVPRAGPAHPGARSWWAGVGLEAWDPRWPGAMRPGTLLSLGPNFLSCKRETKSPLPSWSWSVPRMVRTWGGGLAPVGTPLPQAPLEGAGPCQPPGSGPGPSPLPAGAPRRPARLCQHSGRPGRTVPAARPGPCPPPPLQDGEPAVQAGPPPGSAGPALSPHHGPWEVKRLGRRAGGRQALLQEDPPYTVPTSPTLGPAPAHPPNLPLWPQAQGPPGNDSSVAWPSPPRACRPGGPMHSQPAAGAPSSPADRPGPLGVLGGWPSLQMRAGKGPHGSLVLTRQVPAPPTLPLHEMPWGTTPLMPGVRAA